jgi:molybdopterin converting factor small subunit
MKVTIKLLATYRRAVPEGTEASFDRDVPSGSTVQDVLARLQLPSDDRKVVLVNGRGVEADYVLQEGDTVAVFPAAAGG